MLIKENVTIKSTFGADGGNIVLEIKDGKIVNGDFYIHFPIPMKKAWDNVIYTCSVMLFFKDEQQINDWCTRYNIKKGDVQLASKIFEFAKAWYGKHLHPNWKKWTTQQAIEIFKKFDLTGDIWEIPASRERF